MSENKSAVACPLINHLFKKQSENGYASAWLWTVYNDIILFIRRYTYTYT